MSLARVRRHTAGLARTTLGNAPTSLRILLFVNPEEGDFDIEAMSPVIDAGDTMLVDLPLDDFRGRPRPTDGDGDGVAEADIGAFEYQEAIGGGGTVALPVVRTWPSAG